MECPSCKHGLAQYKYQGVLVDICRACGGIWFDPGEMEEYIHSLLTERRDIPDAGIDLYRHPLPLPSIEEPARHCPSCGQLMRKLNYAYDSNIILDRCAICRGIWVDSGEIDGLAIYTKGNPRLTALANSIIDDQKKQEILRDLGALGKSLSEPAGITTLFFPRLILPLGAEEGIGIVPGTVLAIILVNVVVFLYQSFFVTDIDSFFEQYGLISTVILSRKRYFSFVSSLFVHGEIFHLGGNMFFFWIFGRNVEERLGHILFLILYLLFGFSGGLLHVLIHGGSSIPAIGASGAIAGVMGAYFILYPYMKIRTFIVRRVVGVPAYVYLGIWILLQIAYGMISFFQGVQGGVGWFAHIGGFVSGLSLTWTCKRLSLSMTRDRVGPKL